MLPFIEEKKCLEFKDNTDPERLDDRRREWSRLALLGQREVGPTLPLLAREGVTGTRA